MDERLQLFVWEGVLTDYTDGMMVALAHDANEARELLRKLCDWLPEQDLEKEPEIVTGPKAFYVYGGS